MVVIHAQGQRVCLECLERFDGGDENRWLARHLGPHGCGSSGSAEAPVTADGD
jgi:hypothetical protein